jgi:hypothetical protein
MEIKVATLSLYGKLAKIQSELEKVYRDKKIETTKGSYNVTTEASVLELVRPKLVENNLLYFPIEMAVSLTGSVALAQGKYMVVDADTGESITIASIGAGHDVSDKHAGKAMTYCGKYGLVKLFNLTGTDDPDLCSSDMNIINEKKAQSQAVAAITTKQQLVDRINEMIVNRKVDSNIGARLLDRAMSLDPKDIAAIKEGAAYISSLL